MEKCDQVNAVTEESRMQEVVLLLGQARKMIDSGEQREVPEVLQRAMGEIELAKQHVGAKAMRIARLKYRLARLFAESHDFVRARQLSDDAGDAMRKALGFLCEEVAEIYHFYGEVCAQQGLFSHALGGFHKALAVYQFHHGASSKQALEVMSKIAAAYVYSDELEKAFPYMKLLLEPTKETRSSAAVDRL